MDARRRARDNARRQNQAPFRYDSPFITGLHTDEYNHDHGYRPTRPSQVFGDNYPDPDFRAVTTKTHNEIQNKAQQLKNIRQEKAEDKARVKGAARSMVKSRKIPAGVGRVLSKY